ncbi:MAG: PIG-L deacetylase family protein [Chloroflexaceae bacterium]
MSEEQLLQITPGLRPTMLTVLAHPDDESFGLGGTLAFYAWCGTAVHLVCATGGEVGHSTPEMLQGYSSLAELRTDELRCAAAKLGLASVELLGYRDSGMPGTPDNQHPQALAAAPLPEVVTRVTRAIRRVRPQVVITFDPIGGYRHPDHIAIHLATVEAFHAAGNPDIVTEALPPYQPQKLYFTTFSRRLLRLFVTLMPLFGKDPRRFGRNQDVDLASIALEQFPIHAWIDFLPVAEQKAAAIACHASQGSDTDPSLVQRAVAWLFRHMSGKETFIRAYPPPTPQLKERDLFAGVEFAPGADGRNGAYRASAFIEQ